MVFRIRREGAFESHDSPCYRPPIQPVFTSPEAAMRPLRDFLLIVVIIFWANVLGHAQSPDEVRLSITKDLLMTISCHFASVSVPI
jgi:hypothetical protein